MKWVRKNHSARDLAGWRAFDRISPIGALRDDIRAATICRWLAIGVFSKDVGPLSDFMLQYDFQGYDEERESRGERRTTPEEMAMYYAALKASQARVKAKQAARMEAMKSKRRAMREAKAK